MGLQGVAPGRKVRTTAPAPPAACPLDRINRQFEAPRPPALWASDLTYVATILDAYARRIIIWRVCQTARAGFVPDALEQVLHERRPVRGDRLVHHSNRGASTSHLATPTASPRRTSSHPSAVSAKVTTMLSRRRSPEGAASCCCLVGGSPNARSAESRGLAGLPEMPAGLHVVAFVILMLRQALNLAAVHESPLSAPAHVRWGCGRVQSSMPGNDGLVADRGGEQLSHIPHNAQALRGVLQNC